MKLVRYGALGAEKPGMIDQDGALRDLSGHLNDIEPSTLTKDRLSARSTRAIFHWWTASHGMVPASVAFRIFTVSD